MNMEVIFVKGWCMLCSVALNQPGIIGIVGKQSKRCNETGSTCSVSVVTAGQSEEVAR